MKIKYNKEKPLRIFFWAWFPIAVLIVGLSIYEGRMIGATITPGYVFATNELVTAAKLTSLASGTITGIDTADLADSSVTTAKLSANSVTGAKIVNGTIEGGDISNRTITASLIVTNAITEYELNTNISFRTGFLNFTNAIVGFNTDAIGGGSVVGVTTSAGAGDSGKIPKLNASGKLDSTFLSANLAITTTNLSMTTEVNSASANVYYDLVTIVFNQTNGVVIVDGLATVKSRDSTPCTGMGARLLQIAGGVTNIVQDTKMHAVTTGTLPVHWMGTIAATNTFILQGTTDTASAQVFWGFPTKDYYQPPVGAGNGGTNTTLLTILNIRQ